MTWSDFCFNRITSCCVGRRLPGERGGSGERGGNGDSGKEARVVTQVTEGTDLGQIAVRCTYWTAFLPPDEGCTRGLSRALLA